MRDESWYQARVDKLFVLVVGFDEEMVNRIIFPGKTFVKQLLSL
jgi:hypothetical protein